MAQKGRAEESSAIADEVDIFAEMVPFMVEIQGLDDAREANSSR
jgi:hypothetical protein